MSGPLQELPVGVQNFPEIIKDSLVYVDKTAYISEMISRHGVKAWLLSRPRRFGKSLVFSTLKTLFSGQRELFNGLAIENRLDEKIFAPRPVIALDMSLVTNNLGIAELQNSLGRVTSSSAIWREDEKASISPLFPSAEPSRFERPLPPGEILFDLIKNMSTRSGQKVAVLIDEYDKPYMDLIRTPEEAEKIRVTMRDYYTRLKAADEYISFIFITGIGKFARMGVFSSLNNLLDISTIPEFAAICGFTHQELSGRLGAYVEEAAIKLGKKRDDLLEELKDYYDGFSFDGKTRVYNPFSTLLFFTVKKFNNFWFNSGTPKVIAQYIKDNRLTVEEFHGRTVSKAFVENPGEIDTAAPMSLLYQAGYLSLRADDSDGEYVLDYPNREVYQSMSRLLVGNFLGGDINADDAFRYLRKILGSGDPDALIGEFAKLLAKIPYDIYSKANREDIKINNIEIKFGEWMYHANLLSFLIGSGVNVRAKARASQGQSDLVVSREGRVWVIELKMAQNGDDAAVAKAALKQIREKDYAAPYDNPILLGIAINEAKRTIGAWEVGYKTRR
ncbi:MAG: ATP-binding protein [Deltaproteobacteria bacterium]|jgi:hypothetical protein|nr:ATP-binding protein [Deltaproteobacteria bacterium]